jgi:hypothetical protein
MKTLGRWFVYVGIFGLGLIVLWIFVDLLVWGLTPAKGPTRARDIVSNILTFLDAIVATFFITVVKIGWPEPIRKLFKERSYN